MLLQILFVLGTCVIAESSFMFLQKHIKVIKFKVSLEISNTDTQKFYAHTIICTIIEKY